MNRIVVHIMAILVTFLISVGCTLLFRGMLQKSPPFVGAPAGTAVPSQASPEGATAAGASHAGEPQSGHGDAEIKSNHGEEKAGEHSPHGSTIAPDSTLQIAFQEDTAPPLQLETSVEQSSAEPDTSGADEPAVDLLSPALGSGKLTRMVRVYEKMKPKQVAQILDSLPDQSTVAILDSMSDRAAAKVIAMMDPGNAARLSQVLVQDEDRR